MTIIYPLARDVAMIFIRPTDDIIHVMEELELKIASCLSISMESNMFWKIFSYVAVIAALAVSGCNNAQKRDQVADDVAAIKAMSAARAKAFNEERAADIARRFTEDGVLMAPGAPTAFGRQAVERYYQSIFDQYSASLESGYDEVQVSGDLAFGRGFANVRLVPRGGGDTLVSTAKYINILERQPDGAWLTTHDVWNSNE